METRYPLSVYVYVHVHVHVYVLFECKIQGRQGRRFSGM